MKQNKKWMLVVLALLAVITVVLPLVGCKNDSVSEPVKYTVKFSNGENTEFTGTVPPDLTVVSGTKLTAEQLKDLDDTTSYTFDGWHDGENKAEAGYEVKKNVTLTAKWTKKGTVATVSFNSPGGTVDAGTKVKLTTATVGAKIKYKLTGDEGWTEYTADTEIIINRDTTITAKATKAGMLPSEETTANYHIHSFDWVGDANTYKVTEKCTVCGQSREIPDFVYVKGGEIEGAALPWNPTENYEKGVFIAGRTVTLSDFFIGKYEVTQAEYEEYCSYGSSQPSETYGDGDKYPAYYVSWYDAVVYCNKRSMAEGLTPCYKKGSDTNPDDWGAVPTSTNADWDKITCDFKANGYRLPTEAEWEYAARGGKPSTEEGAPWKYQWAGTNDEDSLKAYAWYKATPGVGEKTHEVGKKTANSLGIHDMSGNVFEWCWDWHDDDPKAGDGSSTSVTNPTGPSLGSLRVCRGGGWDCFASYCSVSNRGINVPYIRFSNLGFRVVRGL